MQKGEVKKFFDSVDQQILLKILSVKIRDEKTYKLLREIIGSFCIAGKSGGGIGMPIGNLTSQIFANIYLNEFDRFVKHILKPKEYLRYGDDFIMIEPDLHKLSLFRTLAAEFLQNILKLQFNPKSDKIFKARYGLKFLGVVLWPNGRKLNKRNFARMYGKLALNNSGSYFGVMKYHANYKKTRRAINTK